MIGEQVLDAEIGGEAAASAGLELSALAGAICAGDGVEAACGLFWAARGSVTASAKTTGTFAFPSLRRK